MNSELLDRVPPNDLGAEKSLLCSIILKPRIIDEVADIVTAADFYRDENKTLFQIFQAMDAENIPIDGTNLVDRLKKTGNFEKVGGHAYLGEVAIAEAWAANAKHYAMIVSRHAKMRAIIAATTEALRDAFDPAADPKEVLDALEQLTGSISLTGSQGIKLIDAKEAAILAIERMDRIADRGGGGGQYTGIRVFDELTGGLFPGEFIVLSARSGIGKTSLVCQILAHNAAKKRLSYMATLEMDAAEIATKMICTLALVDNRKIRTNFLSPEERDKIAAATAEFSECYLRFDDRPILKFTDIRRATRKLAKEGIKLAIVDYLQIVTPGDEQNREQQIATLSRQFKALARELKIPVIVLCQSNRDAEKDKNASLRHLRESDAIGHNADVVLMLETGAMGSDKENEATLTIAKNRNGPKGKIILRWSPQYTLFSDPAGPAQSPTDNRPSNRNPEFDAYSNDF